jgi:cobalt-zinc-cadmium efflux system membrane fusion protein
MNSGVFGNSAPRPDEARIGNIPSFAVLLLCAATLTLMLAACGGSSASKETSNSENTAIQLTRASYETTENEIAIPATVQADPARVVHILPPVSGRLIALSVRPGQAVKAGQTIALIQSSDATGARVDYDKAKIEAERTQRAEQRALILLQHEVLAQKDYEDIKAQAANARSDLARTRERLRVLGLSAHGGSDDVTLKSPRAGVVTEIGAANGELSKSLDNATSIATIADLSSVWIVGDVYEKDLSLALPNTPVKITFAAFPNQTWSGRISNVSDFVDPSTRSLKVRVVLPNPDRKLKPAMFANIHLIAPKKRIITVPSTAVLHEGDATFVMVKRQDGSYEKRKVVSSGNQGDKVEIGGGLQPGENVVTSGAELVRDAGAGQS